MTAIEKVGLLDSNDTLLVSDYDYSAFELRLTDNTWGVLFDDVDVKTEFDLNWTSGDMTISAWNAIIVATRTTSTPIANKKIAVRYQLSDIKTLTGTGTKIYIELDQTLIDDPTLIEDTYPSTDYAQGKNIGTMRRTADRPTTNPYIKLWEYTGWEWVDNRDYPKLNGDKIDLDYIVKLTWNQTISDIKTFLSSPIIPTPTTDYQASTKKYVDDNLASIWDQHKLTNSDFMTWEDLVEWDSIFQEEAIEFTDADQEQNIWYITSNTRVSTRAIWSWTAWNTLKLSLAKVVSPSVDLWIRIETDNAGEPSGTLVDANATATIAPWDLTTSLTDETVTLAWSITIPKWDVVHIVLYQWTYGSETVNETNHYKIGFDIKNTTLRGTILYNGTDRWVKTSETDNFSWTSKNTVVWSSESWTQISQDDQLKIEYGYDKKYIFDNYYRSPNYWNNIEAQVNMSYTNVNGSPNSSSYLLFREDDNNYIAIYRTFNNSSPDYSWNFVVIEGWATTYYNKVSFAWNGDCKLVYDWSIATAYYYNNGWVQLWTYACSMDNLTVNLTGGKINVSNYCTQTFDDYSVTYWYNLRDTNKRIYVDSDLFTDTLYSKTDASYTYKLPDIPRIVDKAYSAGEIPKRDFKGISKHLTGLNKWDVLFVSDTPWALSNTAGTNSCILWKVIDTDELLLNRKVQSFPITVTESPFTWTNETNNPVQIKITGWTVNPIVLDWVTVATATNHINTVPAWKSVVITYSSVPTVVYSDI